MSHTDKRGGSITVRGNGPVLRQLRKNLNLRQRDVEARAGLPTGRLSRYERSEPAPIEHLKLLSRFYGCSNKEISEPSSMLESEDLTLKLINFHGLKLANNGDQN